jgi:hypothetical protein
VLATGEDEAKKTKEDDAEGQRKKKKVKGAPEEDRDLVEDGSARCEHPRPKPLYRAKKTTGPAPASTDEGAGPRAFPNGRAEENPRDGVVSAPPPIATSTASSGSGGQPNTV